MAQRKGSSEEAKKRGGRRKAAEAAKEPERKATRRRASQAVEADDRVLDAKVRRDIAGVGLIVAAVVLMLCAVLPVGDGALVASAASTALHAVLGIGAYILPLFLAAMGVSFLVRFDRERVSLRLAIGLSIIFVALLALIATLTPIASLGVDDPMLLFGQAALTSHGGYVGAAIAWCGITLFGKVITGVILVGVMVIGATVIGFSISSLIERLRQKRSERLSQALQGAPAASGGFGGIRRGRAGSAPEGGADAGAEGFGAMPAAGNATLSLLTARGRRHGDGAAEALAAPSPEAVATVREAAARTQALYDAPPWEAEPTAAPAPAAGATVPLSGAHSGLVSLEGLPSPLGASAPAAAATRPYFVEAAEQEGMGAMLPVAFDGEAASTMTRKLGRRREEGRLVPIPQPEPAATDPDEARHALDALVEALQPRQAEDEGLAAVAEEDADGPAPAPRKRSSKAKDPAQPALALGDVSVERDGFALPPLAMLAPAEARKGGASAAELQDTAERLGQTLQDFGINAEVVGWVAGPTVTLFKVDLPSGVRVNRVTALNDDLALALAAPGVRIFAPIPNTNYVGIEVPNRTRQTVLLSEVLERAPEGPLQIAIGKDVEGNAIVSDLAKMPHLLIGGTTGSGKSVSINAMIMSILMRATPAEVRFIMVDPKRVEFTPYNGIPHLYVPVVTEPKEAASALAWGVAEMERRLKVFSKVGARNISQFNAKVEAGAFDEGESKLPYIVIIIDELADLMMNVGKEVEFSISRIAQLARAAGIHLIVATQRPSTNVVTGLIKANITNRIAFNVASGIDSRVILDTPGAENLIGLGDLLLSKPELAKPQRIQGCYVSEDEIFAVVEHLKGQGEPEYHSEILSTNVVRLGDSSPDGAGGSEAEDPLLWEAAEIVVTAQLGSTSNIQRRLKVGYARAGRIMDQLEEKGVVGQANGSRPREVLVDDVIELETLKAFDAADED